MAMIYVYRRASSTGARELAEALGGKRFRGRVRPIEQQAKRGDFIVSWGETLAAIDGVKILNGGTIRNKYQDALKLKEAGVATIEVALRKPQPAPPVQADVKPVWEDAIEMAEDFIEVPYNKENPAFMRGVDEFADLLVKLKDQLKNPPRVQAVVQLDWLPRLNNHVGGEDLLNPPAAPDYWVKKENIVEEVRVHSFLEKSIRAGKKVHRAGVAQPNAWIRSYDGGWSIQYDNFESTKGQRELAHAAVKALGLQFGAVDLAKRADGKWIVLEVNRAPGLEGGSVATYAAAIKKWMGVAA